MQQRKHAVKHIIHLLVDFLCGIQCCMDTKEAIQAAERRAFIARRTMSEVCDRAGINLSVWSRAKGRGTISAATLRKVEEALSSIESDNLAAFRRSAMVHGIAILKDGVVIDPMDFFVEPKK